MHYVLYLYPLNFELYEFVSLHKYKLHLNFEINKKKGLRNMFDISQSPFLCGRECGRRLFSKLQTQIPRGAREINKGQRWSDNKEWWGLWQTRKQRSS